MAEPKADSERWTSSDVIRRGLSGATALGLRQLLAQSLNIAGGIILANLLTPAEFGLYGITMFLLHALVGFGDVGLVGSLIREPETPTEEDYRAVFTAQQLLVALVVPLGLLVLGPVSARFEMQAAVGGLFLAALVALVVTSFQSIPAVRLERDMRFDRLAIVEVGQAFVFNGAAVTAAWFGQGASAFAWALVGRALIGATLVQVVSPWRPAWRWDTERVKSRLRFGIPYQGTLFVNLLRDALTPIYIGITLGEAVVGAVFWATMMATYPLLILHMLGRLFLPAFARLQENKAELKRATGVALFATTALAIPASVSLLVFIEPVTQAFFGDQWLEAVPIYRLLWLANLLEPMVIVSLAVLNAHGRSGETFRFVASLSLAVWVVGVPLILWLGPIGFGVTSVVLQPVKLWLIYRANEAAGGGWLTVSLRLWAVGLPFGLMLWGLTRFWVPEGMVSVALTLCAAAAFWFGLLAIAERERVQRALRWLLTERVAA